MICESVLKTYKGEFYARTSTDSAWDYEYVPVEFSVFLDPYI